ncbi:MAG: hypothetical protein Q9168_006754 [Polycauliona sp. 1 TL-2023]
MSVATVVAEPVNGEDVKIDLVFVHGLSDNWQSTWNKHEVSWIQNTLPNDIPHARIFTCGFNHQNGSHKDTLLPAQGLQDYERNRDQKRRPVIFLAHSLAGLVLQAFLQDCTLPLRTSTKGIMLFGTPNGIHKDDQRLRFASAMASIGCTFDNEYLAHLGSSSAGFPSWLDETSFAGRVVCFYERLPVKDDLMIVEKQSAIIPLSETRGLNTNHMDMTAFALTSDTNYQTVLQCLRQLYCLADEGMGVLLRHSVKATSQGRLNNLPNTPDGCEEVLVSTQGNPAIRDTIRLALVAEDQGHYSRAEERYREAIISLKWRRHCSPVVRGLCYISKTHAERDDDVEVEVEEEFERDSMSLQGKKLPEHDDAAVLFCIDKWSCLMRGRGRYKKAELYSRYCSKAKIRLLGKRSASTLMTIANWVSSLDSVGRYSEARNAIRDALEHEDQTLPNNVATIQLLHAFAKVALSSSCLELAESLLCDVLRKAIYIHGFEHPYTLNCMSELAAILAQNGNMSSAEALSRRSLGGLEQTLGNDHPDCLRSAGRLADYICSQHRYGDAILRYKQILAKQKLRIGNQHPDTLITSTGLGIAFGLHDYGQDAERILDVAFSSLRVYLGANDAHTVSAAGALKIVRQTEKEQDPQQQAIQGWRTELAKIISCPPGSAFQRETFKHMRGDSLFLSADEDELLHAVASQDEDELRSILTKSKANQQILGRALREAAATCGRPILTLLLEFDAPVNAQSGYHGSALQAASLAGNQANVELLLAHEADVNQEGGILGNALRAAVLGGHESILRLLLVTTPSCGLSSNVLDTSLQLALRTGHVTMINLLIEAGANINAEDKLFGSPLQQASFHGQADILRILLDHKANINMQGGVFTTPLRAAIETQNESAISTLLGAGAGIRSSSPGKLPDEDEQKQLAKILLNRLADSLPYRALAGNPSSHDCIQISKQSSMYVSARAAPAKPSSIHHGTASHSSDARSLRSPRLPHRVSTMKKRIFVSKGEGNAEGSMESQSMEQGLMRKPKRKLTQLFGRKSSTKA